ncbi:MAG: KamA family radical SAM protein [Syntrophales bacterium]|jgi:lysine 2,3-aminomutase|nr:KamA family radical SAM protein [Syntrophales bacterium]MDY0043195.1 KamA family radical SAM protein [Syntrophales bacterium]
MEPDYIIEETEPPGSRYRGHRFEQKLSPENVFPSKTAKEILKPARGPGFFISPEIRKFKRHYYKGVTDAEWNDWHWQIRHRIASAPDLERIIEISADESEALSHQTGRFPFQITPYYASLLDPVDPHHPLRRTVVPVTAEEFHSAGEEDDPLGEEAESPVPGIVHRYPDRVLFLVSDLCSTYCRYCTRSRLVGRTHCQGSIQERIAGGIKYIAANRQIRDVLVSGGDPLMFSDERLEWILVNLRRIPHVEVIRIGTKTPAVLPQRITANLVRMLRRYNPLWMSLHFTHPEELTDETNQACERLADAGIPLQSQTVLLSGINDSAAVMMELFHKLVKIRVRPYYLYQCDPISGSSHFRTPVATGISIIKDLRGYTSGFAVPLYVIDTPGGGGKVPVMPEYVMGHEGNTILLKNYEGKIYRYEDNPGLSKAICEKPQE